MTTTQEDAAPAAPLHERAYLEIRQALVSGRFAPGHKMTSRGLAAALGTSDMPVRAAIGRLVAEGGLVQRANGTVVVPVLKRERFAEIMELRALLEGRATLLACAHIRKPTVAVLKGIAKELGDAVADGDIVRYLDANHRFKFTIYGECRSPVLLQIIENLWLQAGPFLRHLTARSLQGAMSVNHHNDAVRAMAAGQHERAAQAVSADVEEGMRHILAMVDFPEGDELAPVQRLQVGKAER